MNKKTTAKALLATMGLTVLMPAASALAATDINGHWCENIIEKWEKNNLIAGYEDGTFRPDQPITRAEFVSLVNRYLGYTAAKTISFSDVAAGDWYANQVAIAVNAGYVGGFEDNTFRPGDNITRAQTASIIARLTGLSNNAAESYKFADAHRNPEWAKGAIGAVAAKGYMIGDEKNNFDAPDPLTRAEAVAILDRLSFLLDGGKTDTTKPVVGGGGGGSVVDTSVVVPFDTKKNTKVDGNIIETKEDTKLGKLVIETEVDAQAEETIENKATTTVKEIPDDVHITKVTLPAGTEIWAYGQKIILKQAIEKDLNDMKTGEYSFDIKEIFLATRDDSPAYALLEAKQNDGVTLIHCKQGEQDGKSILNWTIKYMDEEDMAKVFSQLIVTLEKEKK